jgi:hypothetical protein
MKKYSFLSLILLSFLFLGFNSSCSKDDDKADACSSFTVIPGEITVNGVKQKLSVAQFIAVDQFYSFLLTSISDDCNETKTIDISIDTAIKLGGTYQIGSSSSSASATGSLISQTISPISQSLVEFKSGTVKVTELGVKKYTIDVDAVDVTGGKTKLSITHQF